MKKSASDTGMYCFWTIVSIVVFFLIPHYVVEGRRVEISPRFWTYIATVAIFFLSAAALIKKIRLKEFVFAASDGFEIIKQNRPQIFLVIIAVLYIQSMRYVGYLVSTPIILFLLLRFFGSKRMVLNLVCTVLFSVFTWYLFDSVFRISLPRFTLF